MELDKIKKEEETNKELAIEKISFESTLKSLKGMSYGYIKDLGVGKFGKVVEMLPPNSKTTYAIKMVREKNISDGELYLWSSLSHENILSLISFNYIAENRTFIFITKKCQLSLDKKLGNVEFIFDSKAFNRAISWVQGVAMGITYLHEKKIAHFDIKTNNVLISDEDRALVADFGSLTSIEKSSSSYTSPLPYRPPETYGLDGNWELVDGLKYDSWTLGMLCIRVFTRENFCQKISQHKNFWTQKMYPSLFDLLQKKYFASKMRASFPRSQNCSQRVDDVLNLIRSCLHLDPEKRITVKDALNHRLFGGEVLYELEENSPWKRKVDYQEIEILIGELKIYQRNTSVFTEECHENNSVEVNKVEEKEKMKTYDNDGRKIKHVPVEKIEKEFNDKEIKIYLEEKMPVSNEKEANCNRSNKDEKSVCDDKRMPEEVILSARALFKDVKSQGDFGYLKEMDCGIKQVPEIKRTHAIADWAREKKKSFSKMFARYRSNK